MVTAILFGLFASLLYVKKVELELRHLFNTKSKDLILKMILHNIGSFLCSLC